MYLETYEVVASILAFAILFVISVYLGNPPYQPKKRGVKFVDRNLNKWVRKEIYTIIDYDELREEYLIIDSNNVPYIARRSTIDARFEEYIAKGSTNVLNA